MNHSSSKGKIIFVPRLLKFSHVLFVLQLAWMRTFPQFSWIMHSSLAPFPGCQDSCVKVPNGAISWSFPSVYMRAWSLSIFSLDTNLNYMTTMFQLRPPLNYEAKLWQLFRCILMGRYVSPAALSPGPETVCWIFWQNM